MVAAAKKSAVPGLARGVEILRLLEDGRQCSLDELARHTRYPKSSLLRILETLRALGLVSRDEAAKQYYALERLIPLRHVTAEFANALSSALKEISSTLGSTAEWWEPTAGGMVLVRRSEPELGGAQVIARVGFVRLWNEELDAVACVGAAWYENIPPAVTGRVFAYVDDGAVKTLSMKEMKDRIARARRDGCAADGHYNINGVRRMACAVSRDGAFCGALAVAECYRPGADQEAERNLRFLLEKAASLSAMR